MTSDHRWPFDQSPHTAAIVTRQVLEQGLPIRLVTHYEDDHSWAFLCGTTDDYNGDIRLICMSEVLELDATLEEIAGLAPGWNAWRDGSGCDWTRYQSTKE